LNDLDDEDFDIILCNLVLLNLECLEKSLREFYRLLRPKGFLVFSIVHPAFNVNGPGHWELGEKDSESGRREGKYFVMDNYYVEKEYAVRWKTRDGKGFPEKFSFFHRTISTYVKLILQIGFRLTGMEEPRPEGHSSFFDREHRIPFFLVLRAEKE
jgi:SAM-dependent methyltransferase